MTLNTRSRKWLRQTLDTSKDHDDQAPMEWDDFVKLMEGLGFTHHPIAIGSAVRFDPPNPVDPPIIFHKPHPDPRIPPMALQLFGKKLKLMYGWVEDLSKDAK